MDKPDDRTMPKEMAGAAGLMAHPFAGAAALSALGVGLASQTFGVWMGALAGVAEVSQRLFQPVDDAHDGGGTFTEHKRKAATPSARRQNAQNLQRETKEPVAKMAKAEAAVLRMPQAKASKARPMPSSGFGTAAVSAEKADALLPEDFRQPITAERPSAPDDLKAISGVGPKLEQVLNGLGVWSYAQIAGWTDREVAWIEDYLEFKGRIGRDDWLGQAAALAAGRTKQ
jgi:NADH-quinone oxidoreductase subunit E